MPITFNLDPFVNKAKSRHDLLGLCLIVNHPNRPSVLVGAVLFDPLGQTIHADAELGGEVDPHNTTCLPIYGKNSDTTTATLVSNSKMVRSVAVNLVESGLVTQPPPPPRWSFTHNQTSHELSHVQNCLVRRLVQTPQSPPVVSLTKSAVLSDLSQRVKTVGHNLMHLSDVQLISTFDDTMIKEALTEISDEVLSQTHGMVRSGSGIDVKHQSFQKLGRAVWRAYEIKRVLNARGF